MISLPDSRIANNRQLVPYRSSTDKKLAYLQAQVDKLAADSYSIEAACLSVSDSPSITNYILLDCERRHRFRKPTGDFQTGRWLRGG